MKPFFVLLLFFFITSGLAKDRPCMFPRDLYYNSSPYMTGDDVKILQIFLLRSPYPKTKITVDGIFGKDTKDALESFQLGNGLVDNGVLDFISAHRLSDLHCYDNFVDNEPSHIPDGYKYKVHLPLFKNRSIETYATLYTRIGNETVFQFKARAHGANPPNSLDGWNQFCSNGNTPTGSMSFDLNSPEPDPQLYGKWPINRVIDGYFGNAAFIIGNTRDGILMHTGEWPDWQTNLPMPNSHGCIHVHPNDIKHIYEILVNAGVDIHKNVGQQRPYPYIPQGWITIEES